MPHETTSAFSDGLAEYSTGGTYVNFISEDAGEECFAYLESPNPWNLSLYVHHGFEIFGDDPGRDDASLFPMRREPRGEAHRNGNGSVLLS